MNDGVTVTDLSAAPADREVLRGFYRDLYVPEFPDSDERESLANIERYLALKAEGWYGANAYHVLVVRQEGRCVAGVIADYLAEANAGIVEFLVVAPELRGRGLGGDVLAHIEAVLDADARKALGHDLDWVVAEMNDPFLVDLTADNMDPFERAAWWGRRGYGRLELPYVQPALSSDQRPVHHLLLAAKPMGPTAALDMPAARVERTLHEYLRWAMRIEVPRLNAEYLEMRRYLDGRTAIPLIPLDRYVGRDPARPLHVEEVTPAHRQSLDAVLAIYSRTFPPGPMTVAPDVIRRELDARSSAEGYRYHLWALRSAAPDPVAGMASFFTMPDAGFGGYIALEGPLRGSGRLRPLVARIEERMRRDDLGAHGWYIECDRGQPQADVFRRVGFTEVPMDYRQPPLVSALPESRVEAPRLQLLYKPFGGSPVRRRLVDPRALLRDVERLYHVVYRLEDPATTPLLVDLRRRVQAAHHGLGPTSE